MNNVGRQIFSTLWFTYFLCYLDRLIIASVLPQLSKSLDLNHLDAGIVLSSFFFGYALTQIPAGVLADRVDPRRLLIIAIVAWSIFTGLTGLAWSLGGLIVTRFLFGVSEGVAPPAVSRLITLHFPKRDNGKVLGGLLAATQIGPALGPPIAVALMAYIGWRGTFFAVAIPGILVALLVLRYIPRTESPKPDPATASEAVGRAKLGDMAPLVKLAIGCAFFAAIIGNAASWAFLNWLPTFLLEARGISLANMGLLAPAPYAAGALGYIGGGLLADRLFATRRHRQIMLALPLAAVCSLGVNYVASPAATILLLMATLFFTSLALAALFSLPISIAPPGLTATAYGIVNTGAQIGAFLSPLGVGAILQWSTGGFPLLFKILAGLFVAAAAIMSVVELYSRRMQLNVAL